MGIRAEPQHAPTVNQAKVEEGSAANRGLHEGPSPQALDKLLGVAQAEANAPNTPSVATAPFEMGDRHVGVRTGMEIPFTNMEQTYLVASWKLTGDPAFRLDAAPTTLRPYHEGFDPTKTIKISVEPAKEGYLQGELEMHASWPNIQEMVYSPPRAKTSVFKVPVRAAAYKSGTATLGERDAEKREEEARKKKESDDVAETKRVDKEIADELEKDDSYHEGDKIRLETERNAAKIYLETLFQNRRDAIGAAKTEVGNFVRRKPPPVGESWLAQFAWMALDIATAGIAEGLAKKLEPMLEGLLTHNVGGWTGKGDDRRYVRLKPVTPTALIGIVTEGVKESVLKGAGAGVDAAKNNNGSNQRAPAMKEGTISPNPVANFFQTQSEALNSQEEGRALNIMTRAFLALVPQVKKPRVKQRSEAAIKSMAALGAGIKAEQKSAGTTQAQESVTQWVRMLAHESLGERDANQAVREGDKLGGNPSLTDMDAANKSFDRNHAQKKHDGLIDIRVAASADTSFAPVTGAKLLGVKRAVATRFSTIPLENISLPIRISSDFNGSAHESVVVVRDEAGNIDYTEKTGGNGPSMNWLGRYGGASKDPKEGAKKLMHETTKRSLADMKHQLDDDSDE